MDDKIKSNISVSNLDFLNNSVNINNPISSVINSVNNYIEELNLSNEEGSSNSENLEGAEFSGDVLGYLGQILEQIGESKIVSDDGILSKVGELLGFTDYGFLNDITVSDVVSITSKIVQGSIPDGANNSTLTGEAEEARRLKEYDNMYNLINDMINTDLDDEKKWYESSGMTVGQNGESLEYVKKTTTDDGIVYYDADGNVIKKIYDGTVSYTTIDGNNQLVTSYTILEDGSCQISEIFSYTEGVNEHSGFDSLDEYKNSYGYNENINYQLSDGDFAKSSTTTIYSDGSSIVKLYDYTLLAHDYYNCYFFNKYGEFVYKEGLDGSVKIDYKNDDQSLYHIYDEDNRGYETLSNGTVIERGILETKYTDLDGNYRIYGADDGVLREIKRDNIITYYVDGVVDGLVFGDDTLLARYGDDDVTTEVLENGDIKIYYPNSNELEYYVYAHGEYYDQYRTSSDGVVSIYQRDVDGNYIKYENSLITEEKKENYIKYYIYDENNLLEQTIYDYENGYTECYDSVGKKIYDIQTSGNKTWYYDSGNIWYVEVTDGSMKYYYESGNVEKVENPDGSYIEYYENGNEKCIVNTNGTATYYYEDGTINYEILDEGIKKSYTQDGYTLTYSGEIKNELFKGYENLIKIKSDSNTVEYYDNNGNLLSIENKLEGDTYHTVLIDNEGTVTYRYGDLNYFHEYKYVNGVLLEDIYDNGNGYYRKDLYDENGLLLESYNKDGIKIYELKDGKEYSYKYDDGSLYSIRDSSGTSYYEDGVKIRFHDNNGNITHY